MRGFALFMCVAMMAAATTHSGVCAAQLQNVGRKALGLNFRPYQWNRSNANSSNIVCPPPGFDSAKNFNLSVYISAPWYVQKQVPIAFQPANELYCVRADYVPLDAANPLGGVLVKNYANRGQVNGPPVGTSGAVGGGSIPGRFIGVVPDPSVPSKLSVGFALGQSNTPVMGAPYWVVAVGPEYEWAIITGGPPNTPGSKGCTTSGPMGSTLGNSGFWFFSRKPVDPVGTAAMEAEATRLGLDTSVLLNVEQQGCTYQGA